MDISIYHPLIEVLWPLGHDSEPEARIAAVLDVYSKTTGKLLSSPPTGSELEEVGLWLFKETISMPVDEKGHSIPLLHRPDHYSKPIVHARAGEKVSWLQQARCLTCIPDAQRKPLGISFSVRTRPFSAQALSGDKLKTLKADIHSNMMKRFQEEPDWLNAPLCVRIVAVIGSKDTRKDVDNMVKGLLDSLQGSVFGNDGYIAHLSVERFRHEADDGFYSISVRPVRDPLLDVIDKKVNVVWPGQPEITV